MPRLNKFSNRDLRDMVCVYAQENYNSRAALRRYVELYPTRIIPDRKIFQRIFNQLGETGSFYVKNPGGRPKTITVEQEEEILVRIAENPELSTRRLEASTGIGKSTVSEVINAENLFPYHFTPVQNLLPGDLPVRSEFCQNLLNKNNEDPMFLRKILFTDEATFTRRGIFNWKNNHHYALENPRLPKERHFQHEFSINIWCGIIDNFLIGPYQLPQRLNGEQYLQFLENDLLYLLDDIPLNIRHNMWYMQDGAPAHFAVPVRNHLNQRFPHRWIGRGSEFPWPPRSPDINPLDFYLWGHMKDLVYGDESNTREELEQKIQEAAIVIGDNQNIFLNVRRHLLKSLRKCIEVNGGHFQHLLK